MLFSQSQQKIPVRIDLRLWSKNKILPAVTVKVQKNVESAVEKAFWKQPGMEKP